MKSALLLNVVVREGPTILQLLARKNEALLIGRDALLVLDLRLDVVDRVRGLNLKRDSLARQGLDEDLHTTAKTEDKVESRLLLNVVIRKSTAVLKLLPGEDEALLVRRDTLFVLNLRFDVVDRVGRLDFERDRLSRQRLDEDLNARAESRDEMKRALLLNIVVREGTAVLELLAREDQALLVRRNPRTAVLVEEYLTRATW